MKKVLKHHQEKYAERKSTSRQSYYGIGRDDNGVFYVTYVDALFRLEAEQEIKLWCENHGLKLDYVGVLN